jgi:hypothetical protein
MRRVAASKRKDSPHAQRRGGRGGRGAGGGHLLAVAGHVLFRELGLLGGLLATLLTALVIGRHFGSTSGPRGRAEVSKNKKENTCVQFPNLTREFGFYFATLRTRVHFKLTRT